MEAEVKSGVPLMMPEFEMELRVLTDSLALPQQGRARGPMGFPVKNRVE
jgi:hypothetical protein